jgi:hypothetical protein
MGCLQGNRFKLCSTINYIGKRLLELDYHSDLATSPTKPFDVVDISTVTNTHTNPVARPPTILACRILSNATSLNCLDDVGSHAATCESIVGGLAGLEDGAYGVFLLGENSLSAHWSGGRCWPGVYLENCLSGWLF